jgi:diacylglycerol kinase
VVIVDLLSSALERVVGRVHFAQHPPTKRAKDMARTAALVSGLRCVGQWCTVVGRTA